MPDILVTKIAEPEQLSQAYADSLETLAGEEEIIGEGVDGTIKVRHVPEEDLQRQLDELNSRTHITRAEIDGIATVKGSPVEGEIGTQAIRLSAAQSRALHGVDKAHARGKNGKGRKVCVIDTGLPQALKNRYTSKFGYLGSAVPGEDVWDESGSSHGGWCSSTIIGIAPEAEHMAIKGLSSENGSGQYSWIIACVNKAVEQGATEINMSLGGGKSETLNSACRAAANKGIRVVVAAGNEQRGQTSHVANTKSPASEYACETTGSKNSDKLKPDYSNIGDCLDVGAIGDYVECPDPDIVPGHFRGTSMASPHMCGMSALVDGNVKAIYATAEDTSESIYFEGAGFADVNAALDKIEPPAPVPPPAEGPPKDCGPEPSLSKAMRDWWAGGRRESLSVVMTRYHAAKRQWTKCKAEAQGLYVSTVKLPLRDRLIGKIFG